MRPSSITLPALLLVNLAIGGSNAADSKPTTKSLAEATAGMQPAEGFFKTYFDARRERLLLEIPAREREFLYVTWVETGLGNNDIGLDRGQPAGNRILVFRRHGPKVFLVQPNYDFRASGGVDEKRAVQESFAESVLWSFPIAAEGADGRLLVDATDFFLQDAAQVGTALKRAGLAGYKVDATRSALYLPRTKNFLDNTEVESVVTFAGEEVGEKLSRVVPSSNSVSVREHHSFIRLPDDGYRPRPFDPRCGYISLSYFDFSVPVGEPLKQHYILRHRLQKKDPSAAVGPAVKPIVYYVDPGTPEPVRSALLEGARWWNQAFEAAGYRDAFRVELLPDGADPLDVRYNVIQWVHRSTRGWAYGSAIVDPRTGEILKGHVTMDSQRIRQVHRLLEGLLGPYEAGKPVNPEVERVALARMRQLSAHEVGHSLGLVHNFASSAAGRASVMDYPHPLVRLGNKGLDLSEAYATGIGAWDKAAIDYGYRDFPKAVDEKTARNAILERARKDGLTFITDEDARPAGGAHPHGHLWDNGADAVEELQRILKVRAYSLNDFSANCAPEGQPASALEDRFVLVYLLHRYQTAAAAKSLGGVDYAYAVRGDGNAPHQPVAAGAQRKALAALLQTLSPEVLEIPDRVLRLLPPSADGHPRTVENFSTRAGPAFDALAGPEAAAGLTLKLLFDPARATRLVEQHARDAEQPGLNEVLDAVLDATWLSKEADKGYRAEIRRTVAQTTLHHLMALAANERAGSQARALASAKLKALEELWQRRVRSDSDWAAAENLGLERIRKFRVDPTHPTGPTPVEPPPGQPIGSGCGEF